MYLTLSKERFTAGRKKLLTFFI